MNKKLLIILSVFFITIIAIVPCCFAENNLKNSVNTVANNVSQGAGTVANDVKNGVGYAGNTVEGAINSVGNNMNAIATTNTYTAARTSTANTITTNNMFWVWVVLAIAAVVIISLVWYYGSRKDNRID